MRRSHDKIILKNIITDKDSGEPRISHRMDLSTGVYNGRQVLKKKESTESTKQILIILYLMNSSKTTIAVDVMGGDNSPFKTLKGIENFIYRKKDANFILLGDQKEIEKVSWFEIRQTWKTSHLR